MFLQKVFYFFVRKDFNTLCIAPYRISRKIFHAGYSENDKILNLLFVRHLFFCPKLVGDEVLNRIIGEELFKLPI